MCPHFGQLEKNLAKYIVRREIKSYNIGHKSGRGAVRLARLHGVQEVGGSNPLAPTNLPFSCAIVRFHQVQSSLRLPFFIPN